MANVDVIDQGMIGSAGTLVAAALETAGHYLQSNLLDVVNTSLGSSYAMLIYVVCAMIAMMTFAVYGSYKDVVWFMVGPAVFYFLVSVRADSYGVHWNKLNVNSSVEKLYRTEQVVNATNGLTDYKDPARVAWFFRTWSRLTDLIVTTVADGIRNYSVAKDLDELMSSSARYRNVFNLQIEDPRLLKFVQMVTIDGCLPYLSAAMGASRELKIVDFDDSSPIIDELGKRVVLGKGDVGRDSLESLAADGFFGDNYVVEDTYTCSSLYKLSIDALRVHAKYLVEQLSDETDDSDTVKATDDDSIEEWARQREEHYKRLLVKYGDDSSIPESERARYMVNSIAARMFGRAFQNQHPDLISMRPDQMERPEGLPLLTQEGYSRELSTLLNVGEYQEKSRYITLMLSLPYLQGFLFYALALVFPFFAFFMIIPGRQDSIIVWMGLWFWAKSWEIGYAVCLLADDLFYYLLPHSPAFTDELAEDPGRAMQLIFQGDPSYSVYIYYHLLATMVAAIPVITGMYLKGGASVLASKVSSNTSKFATQTGSSASVYNSVSNTLNNVGMGQYHNKLLAYSQGFNKAMEEPWVRVALGQSSISDAMSSISSTLSGKALSGTERAFFDTQGKVLGALQKLPGTALTAKMNQLEALAKNYAHNAGLMSVYEYSTTQDNLAVYQMGVLAGWSNQSGLEKPPDLGATYQAMADYNWRAGYSKGAFEALDGIRNTIGDWFTGK